MNDAMLRCNHLIESVRELDREIVVERTSRRERLLEINRFADRDRTDLEPSGDFFDRIVCARYEPKPWWQCPL